MIEPKLLSSSKNHLDLEFPLNGREVTRMTMIAPTVAEGWLIHWVTTKDGIIIREKKMRPAKTPKPVNSRGGLPVLIRG